jgi:hypothetical protein
MPGTWTFEALAQAASDELERILLGGTAPDPKELEGWIYRGWNREWVSKLSGQKFKKGFRSREGQAFGYNELMVQDGQGPLGEWKARMKDGRPRQLGYFRVSPVDELPLDKLTAPFRHLAVFDYDVPINAGVNLPLRVVRDFVALANPGDHSLLLGRAYLKAGFVNVFYCHFVLGHRRPIEHEPWEVM